MVDQQRCLEFRYNFVGIDWTLPAEAVAVDGRDSVAGQRDSAVPSDGGVVVVAGNVIKFLNIFDGMRSGYFGQAGSLSGRTLPVDGPMLATRTF